MEGPSEIPEISDVALSNMRKTIEALAQQIEEQDKKLDDRAKIINGLIRRNDTKRERIAELERQEGAILYAFGKFGSHLCGCEWDEWAIKEDAENLAEPDCDCGYDEALATLREHFVPKVTGR